jgi:hypothetical protein
MNGPGERLSDSKIDQWRRKQIDIRLSPANAPWTYQQVRTCDMAWDTFRIVETSPLQPRRYWKQITSSIFRVPLLLVPFHTTLLSTFPPLSHANSSTLSFHFPTCVFSTHYSASSSPNQPLTIASSILPSFSSSTLSYLSTNKYDQSHL